MTTLVTGGSGFIGAYAIRELLSRGETVVNADVRPMAEEQTWLLGDDADRVKFLSLDVSDLASSVEVLNSVRPNRVIHAAALMGGQPRPIMHVNLDGTRNVLEACRLANVEKVVYVSSVAVLPPAQYEPIDVNHPVILPDKPPLRGFYSASKIACEAICWAYHETYGLDFAVVRPCAVYGFGELSALGIRPMIEDALLGRPTRVPTGAGVAGSGVARSYTHVADVASLAVLAALQPAESVEDRIFFGATDHPMITLGEIADIIRGLIPSADIDLGSTELTDWDRQESLYRAIISIDNARKQLGYEPRTMADGLADSVEKYRAWLAHQGNQGS